MLILFWGESTMKKWSE